MADRATKEVLLRLRKARELELRRAMSVTRAAQAEARRTGTLAEAARRALEDELAKNHARRTGPWPSNEPRRAGRLARAAGFEGALRDALLEARRAEQKTRVALDAAERALADAQRALADAVQARQRSETMAATERATLLRARDRRESAEVEDRYRVPQGKAKVKRSRPKV